MPRCRLCLDSQPRLERSHIVPRWGLLLVRGDQPAPQVGERETERLLCRGCEQALGTVESAAAPLFRAVPEALETDEAETAVALAAAVFFRAHHSRLTRYSEFRMRTVDVAAVREFLVGTAPAPDARVELVPDPGADAPVFTLRAGPGRAGPEYVLRLGTIRVSFTPA